MALDEEYFKMQMRRMSKITDRIGEDVALEEYYPKFQNLSQTRFAEIIEYLLNTWHFPTFPKPADFLDAQKLTYKEDNYTPPPDEPTDPTVREGLLKLAEKYRMPEKNEKKLPKQRDLYIRMLKENMVYSYKLNKWVHESLKGNIGGDFLLPENKLKG